MEIIILALVIVVIGMVGAGIGLALYAATSRQD
jgi:hypothetical protein